MKRYIAIWAACWGFAITFAVFCHQVPNESMLEAILGFMAITMLTAGIMIPIFMRMHEIESL